jgi:uncharacterized membrane protein (DUF485 family)
VSSLDQSPDPDRPRDPLYDELHATPEFAQLRSAFRRFVFPTTAAFLIWYLLFVVMSNWATDFMAHKLWGNVNVALVFGLLQFLTTFLIAWLYARYMDRRVDPLARDLERRYVDRIGGAR